MSKAGDLGKWAEKQTQDWLEARSAASARFAYHRYPDARSARGALAAQPADFLVAIAPHGYAPKTFHLEVKETAQQNRLPKTKIGQFGKLRLFHEAGFQTRLLVYRSHYRDWVVFTQSQLFMYDETPPSFPFAGLTSFPTAAAALEATLI